MSYAQDGRHYTLRHITYEGGQSMGFGKHVVQDTTGKLWLAGGSNALRSYDGEQVNTYFGSNLDRLGSHLSPLDEVLCLAKNNKNNIVFCRPNAIYEFNPYTHELVDSFFTDKDVTGLCYMAIDTSNNHVWTVNYNTSKDNEYWLLRCRPGQKMEKVRRFEVDNRPNIFFHKGQVYVPGIDTIHAVDAQTGTIKSYPLWDNDKIVRPFGMASDKDGRFWIKSRSENRDDLSSALYYFDPVQDRFIQYTSLPEEVLRPSKIIAFKGDDMWIAGQANALYRYHLPSKRIEDYSSLAKKIFKKNFEVFNVCFDNKKTVYAVTEAGLLQILKEKELRHEIFSIENSPSIRDGEERILSVIGLDDHLYASTVYDLYEKSPASSHWRRSDIQLQDSSVTNTVANKWDSGSHRLSTIGSRLLWYDYLIDPVSGQQHKLLPSEIDFRITNYVQGDSIIWMAPYYPSEPRRQVFRYHYGTKQLVDVTPPGSDGNRRPLMFLESRYSDRMWLLYQHRGIYEFTKTGEYIRHIQPEYQVNYCIGQTHPDFLWLGNPQGFAKLHLDDLREEYLRDGSTDHIGRALPRAVESITQTNDSILWLSSYSKLLVYNIHKEAYVTPLLPTDLDDMDYNQGINYYNPTNNQLHATANKGLVSLYPDHYLSQSHHTISYPILITNVTYQSGDQAEEHTFYSKLSRLNTLTLPHDHYGLQITYTLPDLDLENVQYKYKLDGYDLTWINNLDNNQIRFSKLDPGRYRLQLAAYAGNQEKNQQFKTLEIVVNQVWYKRWWAILLWIGSIGATCYWFISEYYSRKLRRQQELDNLKTQISMDLHDDVGTVLTALSMQTDLLKLRVNNEYREKLSLINTLSHKARGQLRDAVWAMDNRKNSWNDLMDRINDFAYEILEETDITFHRPRIENPSRSLNPRVRQNVYLIVKEAITNVVKHSDASEVHCKFDILDKRLNIHFKDNGNVPTSLKASGLGLSNIRRRVNSLNGTFELTTEDGFDIKISVPLNLRKYKSLRNT